MSVPEIALPARYRGYFSLHTHSRFSVNDAMSDVDDLVRRAAATHMPALGLTDHGTGSGWVELYKSCKKHGIKPLPGIELYVARDRTGPDARSTSHLTIAAYTEQGYRNLCALHTKTAENYYFKPIIDMADFAAMHDAGMTEGLVVGTGCYFGLGVKTLREQGPHAATQVIKTLAGWFPKVLVELHDHGVEHTGEEMPEYPNDEAIVEEMVKIAANLGLETFVANDSHYTTREQQRLHNELKTLISWSSDPDDAIFPGGPYSLLSESEMREFFPPAIANPAFDTLARLAEESSVRIPELDTFQLKCPDVTFGGNPLEVLTSKCVARLEEMGNKDTSSEHYQRLNEELAVIEESGMAGMIELVGTVTDFMMARGIVFSARGSASDSYVVFLRQITQIDPLDWGLQMDRFLSRDRTRPPDIDLDVENLRRVEVEAFLRSKFAVVQVGTNRIYKIQGDDDGEDDAQKGSLLVRYYSVHHKRNPDADKIQWKDVPEEDRATLEALAELKLIAGQGTHAAGFIVAPNEQLLAQLPKAYIASSKTTITAYGKKAVEALGFVKLDLLGLKDLTGMRYALEMLDMAEADIPLPKPWKGCDGRVMRKIASGDTDGLFQLKGWAMQRGCKQLKPKNLEDLAAAAALFRPATMKSGATRDYLERRRGDAPVPARHADIMEETQPTYGVLLYQEQVIGVLRRLGMPGAELTDMLDAVKASNEYVAGAKLQIQESIPRIKELGVDRGWNDDDVSWLTGSLEAYADYSFNKGHAAAYAVRSYQSAWLATYHPQAFWAGQLRAFDGSKMVKLYLRWARDHGMVMLPISVNKSEASYSADSDGIRRGLMAVMGVGAVVAAEIERYQPYTSLLDLANKVLPKRVTGTAKLAAGVHPKDCGGTVTALYEAGALNDLLTQGE